MGDAIERAYGDLAWRGVEAERHLPWYALIHAAGHTSGIGVCTGASALCTWLIDEEGITLDLDCRSGGVGVQLGGRDLHLATIHSFESSSDESPFAFAQRFCRAYCPAPRLPDHPVYGANNWYYAYGHSSQQACWDDAERVASWSSHRNRPYMVVDDGWQRDRTDSYNGGPWDVGNADFPDMAVLADGIRQRGARPGLWYRPLLAHGDGLAGSALQA